MNEEEIRVAAERLQAESLPRKVERVDELTYIASERAADDPLGRRRRVWWSVSWAGRYKHALGWLSLFYLWAGSTMATVLLLSWVGIPDRWWHLLFPGGNRILPIPNTVALVIYWLCVRGEAERARKRELLWMKRLPFSLQGYEEALGDDPRYSAEHIELRFQFNGEPPAEEALCELLSGDGGSWQISTRNGYPVRQPAIARASYDHNQPVRRWMRKLVDEQLLPLHHAHPFGAVTLVNRC